MKKYNWAILGCGKIARKFSNDLKLLPDANLYAAASRNFSTAQSFAGELGFEKAYGSYLEMVEDPAVDIVYVATPHSHHHQHTLLCLEHKKAALCEKSFAINLQETKEMTECARKNNVFLMEAFWTRFQPGFIKILDVIRSGELGELMAVKADFAFKAEYNTEKRLYNPDLGGGSLLDIGIYPVFMALATLGKPDRIKALAVLSPTGSEESITISFSYKERKIASLASSFSSFSSILTEFWFENGLIRLQKRSSAPNDVYIWKENGSEERIDYQMSEGFGYYLEARHVMDCMNQGKIESEIRSWKDTLDLMETLDRIRIDAGIYYAGHDKNLLK